MASTCLLYLVAAGLFSRGVWAFEQQQWNSVVGSDASELGDGAGSYDIDKSVWHVNVSLGTIPRVCQTTLTCRQCCNPELNGGGGWGFFNAILGWTNSATYGSVISYNLYWIFVMISFLIMRYREVKGHWPLMKPKKEAAPADADSASDLATGDGRVVEAKIVAAERATEATV